MKKTPALRESTQKKIAEFKATHPKARREAIAKRFLCTVDQVDYAIQQYRLGNLQGRKDTRRSNKTDTKRANLTLQAKDSTVIFNESVDIAIAKVYNGDLDPLSMVKALESISYMKRVIQQTQIEGHIKRADAEIIARIIRRFMPTASDEDIIKIYREEFELWKNSR